jgi:hypothetical protein
MKQGIAAVAAASALAVSLSAGIASAQEQPAEVYVYGSYFHCGSGQQADDAVDKLYKGVYDAAVKDGTISSWGWLVHNTGGEWMRLAYHTASSQKALFAAMDTLDSRTGGKDNEAVNKQFGQACTSHEDYVWRRVAGNDAAGQRGKVGFSVYYVCDSSREDQADALMKRVFAPVYDKMVADGKLTSWGWLEHIIGGKYRRLATLTAADRGALLEARAALVQTMQDDPLAANLDGICGSHADYIWEIRNQAP